MNPDTATRKTATMSAFSLPYLSEKSPMTNDPTSMPSM